MYRFTTPLYKQVVYISANKNPAGTFDSEWSTVTSSWKTASSCDFSEEYLNTTCDYPLGSDYCDAWACYTCPHGAFCNGDRTWRDVKAKFGYWRINPDIGLPSNFARCLFPPACQGGPNLMLKGKFRDLDGEDPAVSNHVEGCALNLGYSTNCTGHGAPRCRLCSTCTLGFKRKPQDGTARCDRCPKRDEKI